ncbi:MAG: M20/M25/M40 family metallo-hydrolase [Candidatus Moranbacteria bacterium]|nr:M20/M25/M40 family metallo-hydrolase [Candidatus Moranbacteria bacterium]
MDNTKEFLDIIESISNKTRLSGSKGESDTVRYLKKYIAKNIGGKTIIQKFKILTWREEALPHLTIGDETISCRSVYYSPKSNIRGTLEYFGESTEEKGNEFAVYCIRSKSKTIVSFLSVSRNYPKPFYYNKGGPTYLIPNLIIGSAYEDFFHKNIGKEVRLKTDTKYVVKNSYNLIHKITHRKNRLKLIVGAHIDTVPHSTGLLDNASGIAGALLVSQNLKKMKLPFDVWVVYFGAEENSMFGSKFFLETLTEEENSLMRYMVAIDGIGLGDNTSIYAEKDYHKQIEKSFGEIISNTTIDDVDNMLEVSDHYYFKLHGVDCCFVEGSPTAFYCHNEEANDIKYLNAELSMKTIQALTEFVINIKFQSPKVVFENKRKKALQTLLRFFR